MSCFPEIIVRKSVFSTLKEIALIDAIRGDNHHNLSGITEI